ncbi:hypothetical protein R1sor_000363 [Riccia sorocarpa]|uniref:Uncharacterized protein n=1 Tax=Riccia sorocarpa TaxID=122646 RepID=A0ABD3GUL1_9MARC
MAQLWRSLSVHRNEKVALQKPHSQSDYVEGVAAVDVDVEQVSVQLHGVDSVAAACGMNESDGVSDTAHGIKKFRKGRTIPSEWTISKTDWHIPNIEFVSIKVLQKGKLTIVGPFKYIAGDEEFVLLEGCSSFRFHHPKFVQKSGTYSSTAAWIWSRPLHLRECVWQWRHLFLRVSSREARGSEVQARSRGAIPMIMPDRKRIRPPDIPTVPSNVPDQPPRAVMARAPEETNAAKPKRVRRVPEQDMDLNLMIGIPGADIEGTNFDLLAVFLEKRGRMAIIATQRGDAHLQLHIQGMISVRTSSLRSLKAEIREAIGWQRRRHQERVYA